MNKILVVDDDSTIRLLYHEELTWEGYDVVTSHDRGDLLELIERSRPDLVIMEVNLQNHNGLDLLLDIRNTYYNLPVILCSAYGDFRFDLRAIAADFFVIKRSDLRELKLKIKMAMESGQEGFNQGGAEEFPFFCPPGGTGEPVRNSPQGWFGH